jgi:hypothetical protein
MIEEPDTLYGDDAGSHYQGQETMLSKHFTAARGRGGEPGGGAGGGGVEAAGIVPLFE